VIVEHKKEQIKYVDSLIYMGEKILFMLNSTSPETQMIINELKNDSRLKNIDLSFDDDKCPIKTDDNERTLLLFNIIGKYDINSQVTYINQYIGYFKMLRQQYQDNYNRHYKLYIAFGILTGVFIVILLI
jgi:stage III sporulation protein AB